MFLTIMITFYFMDGGLIDGRVQKLFFRLFKSEIFTVMFPLISSILMGTKRRYEYKFLRKMTRLQTRPYLLMILEKAMKMI